MTTPEAVPISRVEWLAAVRIIRSNFPPIDLFEDIADPADWPLLIAAEQKSNPRIMATIGNLEQVPEDRRVAGPGASYLMAPFTHCSPERPSRFSDGTFGVLYAARAYETALFETIHHHGQFMAQTAQPAGWTSQFREVLLDVAAGLDDLRVNPAAHGPLLASGDYQASQLYGAAQRAGGSEGIVYPSQRHDGGDCAALFFPNCAANARQGRHLDYHWDGARVDLVREAASGNVFRVVEL